MKSKGLDSEQEIKEYFEGKGYKVTIPFYQVCKIAFLNIPVVRFITKLFKKGI